MSRLFDFINKKPELAYNMPNKKLFEARGKAFLKDTAKELKKVTNYDTVKVRYNPGGIAVGGDHYLECFNEKTGRGVKVFLSEPLVSNCSWVMAREMQDGKDAMKANHWFPDYTLERPESLSRKLRDTFYVY